MRVRKTHTHSHLKFAGLPAPGMGSSACVNVCSLEFQAALAARSELSSLPISLSFTRSLFPTHDPAGAEDKANNELLRQLEEVVEFFVHAKRETEKREKERGKRAT